MDRSPRIGTAHRRAARPPHPPRSHPGDERRQLPSQAEPAQTQYRQLLTHPAPRPIPATGSMPSSASLQTPHSRQIQQLRLTLLDYFYSAPMAPFYSALDKSNVIFFEASSTRFR